MIDVDVIIAGGGPAGCATAGAMAQLGLSVLVAEAGSDRHRQLAGELLHPPGLADLEALGLARVFDRSQTQRIRGFAVLPSADPAQAVLLPYPTRDDGIALEHAAFTVPLLAAAAKLPGIQLLTPARVVDVQLEPAAVATRITTAQGVRLVRARLLVAADGRGSHLRGLLGIPATHERLSTMLGVQVPADTLPHPDRGHLFIAGPAPVLAYAIGGGQARVMVDLPLGSSASILQDRPELLAGLPGPLREALVLAALTGQVRMAANETRLPAAVTRGRVVLVGDAAGCCHPLSASGMASAVRDARCLQTALARHPDRVPAALQLYVRLRRPANRTRIALASALYGAFTSPTDEMAALRRGLLWYWRSSPRGARVSMALLSTSETRMWVMAREYLRVVGYGLLALARDTLRRSGPSLRRSSATAWALLRSARPHLQTALHGSWEDLRRRLPQRAGADPGPSRAAAFKS